MTYQEIHNKIDNETFHSESFGGIVTIKGMEVHVHDGRLLIISGPNDLKDLYNDYKKTQSK